MEVISKDDLRGQALAAAVEIDNAIAGRSSDMGRVSKLLQTLARANYSRDPASQFKALADPGVFEALARTASSITPAEFSTVYEIREWMQKMVEEGENLSGTDAARRLAMLQEFCIKLHKELLSDASGSTNRSPRHRHHNGYHSSSAFH